MIDAVEVAVLVEVVLNVLSDREAVECASSSGGGTAATKDQRGDVGKVDVTTGLGKAAGARDLSEAVV